MPLNPNGCMANERLLNLLACLRSPKLCNASVTINSARYSTPLHDLFVNYALGTVRPDGRPHAAGVGALWLDGDFYLTSGPAMRKARNLAANPACTLSVRLAGIDLICEGEAFRVT